MGVMFSKTPPQPAVPPSRQEQISTQSVTQVLPYPIETFVAMLNNSERKVEWQASCLESRCINKEGSSPVQDIPAEFIEYQRYKLGPLSNRDYVYKCVWTFEDWTEGGPKKASLDVKSVDFSDAPAPQANVVRAGLNICIYAFEKIDADSTKCTFTVNVDPCGSMPLFLINQYQKIWPGKTLDTCRAQAKKMSKEVQT